MGYIGVITHLLTIDPNFQRHIQVDLLSQSDFLWPSLEGFLPILKTHPVWTDLGWGFRWDANLPSRELTYYIPYRLALLKMIFLFQRWDMLVPLRASQQVAVKTHTLMHSTKGWTTWKNTLLKKGNLPKYFSTKHLIETPFHLTKF